MAIDLTGISNINEFYSHHYLDSLLESDLKGLYKKWKETDNRSPYEKLSGIAHKYFKAKTDAFNETNPEEREEITHIFHNKFLEALGYETKQIVKYTEDGQGLPVITSERRDGSEYLWVLETVFWSYDTSVFEQPLVFGKNEEEVAWFDDSIEMAIQHIFRLDEPPRWLVLLAGQKAYLIDRNKWGQGKYLLFDLDELFGRKQAETLKATAALLSKDALAPEVGNILHDELDENSHKHAFSVSEDLKYGIRRAVELIGNEFIYYRSKISKQKIYGDEELANRLTKESLTYLYRLLFLFYAESRSEELNVVPMRSEEYRLGYSLETLRELEQVPLTTEASREGYFLYESLNTLFKIVNDGFGNNDQYEVDVESGNYVDFGFEIDGLQSPLFDSKGTPLLSSVKIRNFVLQEVIQLLSLSKEGGKQRGRISYAQLGINQLGAVYEGLLSYSGFFAQEKLFEVKPASISSNDETGQSYFISALEVEQYNEEEFVLIQDDDGIKRRKKYDRGSFVFRLAGRDREKTASYYTPEVLTKSLVKYSLKQLLINKSADEILELSICEPAMGSGAFLNETINQLADAYLKKKQKELSVTINPDDYSHEKQKVKSYFATNNIYGVDLNPTAVELAKVSLWLNTIHEGAKTPWFSARLGVGNSLIGSRRKVFREEDLISGKWGSKTPVNVRFNQKRDEETIYHFFVPDKGMVSFDKDKFVNKISNSKQVREWKESFLKDFTRDDINTMKELSQRVDEIWNRYVSNRFNMLSASKEEINIWGMSRKVDNQRNTSINYKEEELYKLKNSPTSSYRVLKLIMDYWCALWFWPLDKLNLLPTRDEFLLDITVILDSVREFGTNVDDLITNVERLSVVSEVTEKNKFLHWELEFPEVFSSKDGFDLTVGNPPWIKLKWEEKGVLSEAQPIINLRKLTASKVSTLRDEILEKDKNLSNYLNEFVSTMGQKSFLSSYLYNELKGVQLNLYKSFIVLSIDIANRFGIISFLHSEGLYDEARGGNLRSFLYPRMIYHFQYINELNMFPEVGHQMKFGCTILRSHGKDNISFFNISNLFHPKTIDESFSHTGSGEVPGFKNSNYEWEVRGHKSRIVNVDDKLLKLVNVLYEDDKVPVNQTKLLNIHSNEVISILKKLSDYNYKLHNIKKSILGTPMFDETKAQRDGLIVRDVHFPDSEKHMVYSGPHFFINNPFFQTPNENCKSHGDYSKMDLRDYSGLYARSNYRITEKGLNDIQMFKGRKINEYYRFIYRRRLSPTGERTFIGSILYKGPSHINTCNTLVFNDNKTLVSFAGMASSIVLDFYIRSTGRPDLYKEIYNLPLPQIDDVLTKKILLRTLRLNCLTDHYHELWKSLFCDSFNDDTFVNKNNLLNDSYKLTEDWKEEYAYRTDVERRQAQVELDVLTALVLNLSLEELLTIYRIQFPILQKNEANNYYDQRGMVIPNRVSKYYENNRKDVEFSDPKLEGFIPPFVKFDREKDMRQAYKHFLKSAGGE